MIASLVLYLDPKVETVIIDGKTVRLHEVTRQTGPVYDGKFNDEKYGYAVTESDIVWFPAPIENFRAALGKFMQARAQVAVAGSEALKIELKKAALLKMGSPLADRRSCEVRHSG